MKCLRLIKFPAITEVLKTISPLLMQVHEEMNNVQILIQNLYQNLVSESARCSFLS